jgi:ketosteroid isomerase-like protein
VGHLTPDEGWDMTTTLDTPAARAVRAILAALDGRDVDALCRQVTDDVRLQLGNTEVTTDKSAFEATSRTFLNSIAAIRHELLDLWEVEGGTVIAVMTVHYERLDGQKLSLPCCNLFGTRAGRVHDYRVYMDINPVFAA